MLFSEMFLDQDRALAEFKRILVNSEGYQHLEESQIVASISLFQSWALRQANWRTERAYQEAFLSTALHRASVLAHAEGRQYVPRKPTPSRGMVRFTNTGPNPVHLPEGTRFIGGNQLHYQVTDNVSVPAAGFIDAEVRQTEPLHMTFTVDGAKPFYEIVLDRALSARLSSFRLSIDGVPWVMQPRLMNTATNALIYDEFYTTLDEAGIRFGNGTFGLIPEDGSTVLIEGFLTDGHTELLPNQDMRYLSGSSDPGINLVTARTRTPIIGGRPREHIEEIRKNALYYPLYDEQLVWRDDYVFVIRRIWPEATWVNVWGEQEQERVYGHNVDHIGKIYVSAYAPERADILTEIAERMERPINRIYEPVTPNMKPYTITLQGRVDREYGLTAVLDAVKAVLWKYFHRDSYDRLPEVKLKDFYRFVCSTGFFVMGDFTVELHGDRSSNGLNDLVYLDIENCTFDIGYGE